MTLIAIACLSALIAVIYRYGMGVRVLRSRFNRSKLRDDFNYNLWSTILSKFVSPKSGKVDYKRLVKKKHLLDEYVAMLAVFGPTTTPSLFNEENDKKAYWINAYNALVIFGICEYFPITSVCNIETGFFCCSSSDYYKHQSRPKKGGNKNQRKRAFENKVKSHLFDMGMGNGMKLRMNNKNEWLLEDKNNAQTYILNRTNKNGTRIAKELYKNAEKDRKKNEKKRRTKTDYLLDAEHNYWFFEALRFEVDGSLYSLREIERDIICRKWGDSDARILCCLSKGCIGSPKLSNKAFVGSTLDNQLNAMNRLFCSGVIKDKDVCFRQDKICISSVFKVYKSHYIKYAKDNKWHILSNKHVEYEPDNGALLGYVYHFANKEMKNKLSRPILCNYALKFIRFDWRLNIHLEQAKMKMIEPKKKEEKVKDVETRSESDERKAGEKCKDAHASSSMSAN